MMGHFNKTCKTFTAVNAFKYQLQHYLFHDANNESLEVVQNITSIIIGLQAAAKFLQDIMINNVNIAIIVPYVYHSSLITGHNMCEVQSSTVQVTL